MDSQNFSLLVQDVVASQKIALLHETNRLRCLVEEASNHLRIIVHSLQTELLSAFLRRLPSASFAIPIATQHIVIVSHRCVMKRLLTLHKHKDLCSEVVIIVHHDLILFCYFADKAHCTLASQRSNRLDPYFFLLIITGPKDSNLARAEYSEGRAESARKGHLITHDNELVFLIRVDYLIIYLKLRL